MTLSVEAEISTAVGIVGPEALHAVGDVAAAPRRRAIHDRRTVVVIVVIRFRRVGPTMETEPETRAATEIAVMMVVVMAADCTSWSVGYCARAASSACNAATTLGPGCSSRLA
jgi:hypothetical protein